jgi:hypothetical protein
MMNASPVATRIRLPINHCNVSGQVACSARLGQTTDFEVQPSAASHLRLVN